MGSKEKDLKIQRLVSVIKEASKELDELLCQAPEMPKKRRSTKVDKFADYKQMYAKKGLPV